jgi:RNA polymerase sigma factor (sigma-70 family)
MADHVSDATLLERFATSREDAAFAAIVRRHGPVVRAACRRILPSEHDVDDAVQATFLVLARRAADVAWRDSVSGWLCGVARRLALHARAGASRRSRRETPVTSLGVAGVGSGALPERFHPRVESLEEVVRRDLGRVINQELNRLPDKYREPVQLCDLQGMTHEEAARQLGLPTGSMSRRLGRARAILRERLVGRGLPIAIGLLLFASLLGLHAWRLTGHGERAVAGAMAPSSHGANALQDLLVSIDQVERPATTLREEARMAARDSVRIAERMEKHAPQHNQAAWHGYTGTLLAASHDLARVVDDGDAPSLLAAVRRVNESCIQCHLAFRQ